eukprot:jgi/Botrbrau1/21702/Bobra.43_1s0098.1
MQKKISAFDEFCEFMRDTGRHALQATPQDIKVHMTMCATSSGRDKHQGLDLVGPISMQCLLSFLATEFNRYATTHGNWDPSSTDMLLTHALQLALLHSIRNAVRSLDVAEWASGYTGWLAHGLQSTVGGFCLWPPGWPMGYNPQSAHPWSLDDLQRVLEHCDSRIASTIGVPLLRLHRDAFTMTMLWETCSRGGYCSLLVFGRPVVGLGWVPAAPYLNPTLQIPLGAAVLFKAIELKHNLHPEVMIITRRDGSLCPIRRLHTLLAQSAVLGHPVTQFLCRPLAANKNQFLERSLSVAAFEDDIDTHFIAANIPDHATLHGSRRGALLHHDQQGQSLEALGLLAQIKTPSVTKRYIDPTRHRPPKLPKGANKRGERRDSSADSSAVHIRIFLKGTHCSIS